MNGEMTIGEWLEFQLQLVDYLADSWRLWAVMGAALALLPTGRWIVRFLRRHCLLYTSDAADE